MLNSNLSCFYGLIVVLWVTLFNESWKRCQCLIADEWLVRGDDLDTTNENESFKGEIDIDPDTLHERKVAKKSAFKT